MGMVEVIWKIGIPSDESHATALLGAHWKTVTDNQYSCDSMLIRSDLHNSTKMTFIPRGFPVQKPGFVKDEWHITTSFRNGNEFITAHGYTAGKGNYNVHRTTVTCPFPAPITTANPDGSRVWPSEPLEPKYTRRMYHESYLDSLICK
ncbi:hypothetical protein GQ607_014908 [Colletotrichum asianum]|uniref:Uncharacterized protein n=1 Tax=Colletotrichum asianum TaxID=702518 RepID=A0A8H3VZP9_9PEZI|nr:hypothetical protein GQ607_014908 [Colletotrichum asianum]